MRPLAQLALALFLGTHCVPATLAQTPSTAPSPSWKAISFLNGTWEAKAQGNAGVSALGSYTFQHELGGHIVARHSRTSDCKAPASFDCEHGDLLYIFEEMPGQPLKAIYFDSEGHVIHYEVTTPSKDTVIFLSDQTQPGPRFRLVYELKDSLMSGKFQVQVPGQSEWKSYLEWSGAKK